MGEVINLNKWKKQKQREEKARKGEQNRAKNTISPAERKLAEQKKKLAQKQLDGHKLELAAPPGPDEQSEDEG